MDYYVHYTVHVYGEEELNDQVLIPHSKNYGLCGKEIIAPMRKINGHSFVIQNITEDFTAQDLWDWTVIKLYGDNISEIDNECIRETILYHAAEKFLVFDGLRYKIEDLDKSLRFYFNVMKSNINEGINVQLLVCSDEGEFFRDEGIRYYINSRESGQHHCPHVHVDIKHDYSGTFSLITGDQIEGNIKKEKQLKLIKETILAHQIELLEFWNIHTDGLDVDLNQYLNLIDY